MSNVGSRAVKIAGLGLNWSESHAKLWSNKMEEMGFHTKRLTLNTGKVLIGYSYRTFTMGELEDVFGGLYEKEGTPEDNDKGT